MEIKSHTSHTFVASEIMKELKQTMTVRVISVSASSMMYPRENEPSIPSTTPTTGPAKRVATSYTRVATPKPPQKM